MSWTGIRAGCGRPGDDGRDSRRTPGAAQAHVQLSVGFRVRHLLRCTGSIALARLEAPGVVFVSDGDRVALAVRRDRQLDALALTLIAVVGDKRGVGVFLLRGGHVAVYLVDRLNLRQSPQCGDDARVAAFAGTVIKDGNARLHALDEHRVVADFQSRSE